MATSLEISKKEVQIDHLQSKKLSFDVKIATIGPADLQIFCLRKIIKNDKKIRKKLWSVKHIALSATFAERAKQEKSKRWEKREEGIGGKDIGEMKGGEGRGKKKRKEEEGEG